MKISALILTALLLPLAALADVEGEAKAIDGRTLEVNGQKVLLFGIDAPDPEQYCQSWIKHIPFQCGLGSVAKLDKLVRGQKLICKGDKYDDEGRLIATCYSGRIDINEQAVLTGYAIADPAQTDKYLRAEAGTRSVRMGLWRVHFVKPWEWRKGKRLPPQPEEDK